MFFVKSRAKNVAFEKLYFHIRFDFKNNNNLTTIRINNENVEFDHSVFLIENNFNQNLSSITDDIKVFEIESFFLS